MATSLLSGSVGNGGRNSSADVKLVQMLLNNWLRKASQQPLKVDGIVGPKTIKAISDYQKSLGGVVDGRADPDGPTIATLIALQTQLLTEGVSRDVRKMARTLSYNPDAMATRPSMSEVLADALVKVKKQLG